jgi:L-lactate dehydrogenase complex protein LldG
MNARDVVLGRIRYALGPDRGGEVDVPRAYRVATVLPPPEMLDLLEARIGDYRARVRRSSPQDLPATVAGCLRERGARRVVVPPGLVIPFPDGIERVVDDPPLSASDLDVLDGVVTESAIAIAETGTIVLDASPDQGRRVITLVPDYHLCVVRAANVVGSVPEAVARVDAVRPLTWISGPSATSDIELSRVEGVHGPRTLEVILVVG